ncbi:capsular polysaccharide biosynthesis protein [Jannaschia pagri]|uniref:Capsular polysaccharide biosynthesis protein n=1 Tax=Jannaschia pagri TaxID=2829797 RepID=A0ABQ4NIB6_9RHOB|nr:MULTISPECIES: capsular polysaccharide biosynthesis protein [unclassified Jannaschia]GIT89717.1 capsular polysaccharide biosynthesis protein [Jannaschia sp. AI_61]GIT94175.1 capsular polysaccharide biosynthesis protein [Jannaschia sp. AI_62]
MTTPIVARFLSAGFFNHRIRRIAWLAGVDLRPGWPRAGEHLASWGLEGPSARRAAKVAARTGAPILYFEDAWLRSLHPGRGGEPTHGLLIDRQAPHFDASRPSDLETLLATHPFDDGDLLARTRAAMAEWRSPGVTKYAATRADLTPPDPGYVLVIDQTRGDASITHGGATETTFREMLMLAREDHPNTPVLIKTHPETEQGHRAGHYTEADATHGATLETRPLSPAVLLAGASAVYTVSSQMGLEAILHGHRPQTFGQPAWSGWGLDDARQPVTRRQRTLTRTQLFAATAVLYPKWYDPHRDRLCDPLDVIRILEARARAWREDHLGWTAQGFRLWKRRPVQRFLSGKVRFTDRPGPRHMIWGAGNDVGQGSPLDHPRVTPAVTRVEDGFLRSRGLGAELVPPLSLVLDSQGIYYDPSRRSDLEDAVIRAAALPPEALARARDLRAQIIALGLTKYNLDGATDALPDRPFILVPGQVSDDASIRLGTDQTPDNKSLLRRVRANNPGAVIVYKPHPDVEAGLRDGAIQANDADIVAHQSDPLALTTRASAVWTLTSGLGFEALLRDVPVTTLGAPFYAGWGLTTDLGRIPARRKAARPSLDALTQAVLIDYPRYFDPVTGTPCPPEAAIHRLAHGPWPSPGPANRALSKAQGALANYAWIWRKYM